MVKGGISWGIFFFFLFLYRSVFSFLAQVVVARITSVGDSSSYQSGEVNSAYDGTLDNLSGKLLSGGLDGTQVATVLTFKVGGVFYGVFFGNPILINVGFQAIAFFGLVYLLLSVESLIRRRLAILLMLPSFTLWTSIASKEAIVVFSVSILMAYFIRMIYDKNRSKMLLLISIFILFFFKPHYFPAILFMFTAILVGNRVQQKAFVALLGGLISFALLYLIRDKVDELSFTVQKAFLIVEVMARSTREGAFFVDTYDVFWNAPIGMYRAFVGPTLTEVATSPLHAASLIESIIIIAILLYYVIQRLPEVPIFNIVVSGFTLFWILFPNYPFGVMNPGSAIRYRSGWLLVVMVVCAFLISRRVYVDWARIHLRRGKRSSPLEFEGVAQR